MTGVPTYNFEAIGTFLYNHRPLPLERSDGFRLVYNITHWFCLVFAAEFFRFTCLSCLFFSFVHSSFVLFTRLLYFKKPVNLIIVFLLVFKWFSLNHFHFHTIHFNYIEHLSVNNQFFISFQRQQYLLSEHNKSTMTYPTVTGIMWKNFTRAHTQ